MVGFGPPSYPTQWRSPDALIMLPAVIGQMRDLDFIATRLCGFGWVVLSTTSSFSIQGTWRSFQFTFSYNSPKLERAREILTQRKTSCILQIPKLCYRSIKYLSVSVCPLNTLVYLISFYCYCLSGLGLISLAKDKR